MTGKRGSKTREKELERLLRRALIAIVDAYIDGEWFYCIKPMVTFAAAKEGEEAIALAREIEVALPRQNYDGHTAFHRPKGKRFEETKARDPRQAEEDDREEEG